MAALPLTPLAVRDLKRVLIDRFPQDRSSHLSEALAAALGFNTAIALADAVRVEDHEDPQILLLQEGAFLERLEKVAARPLGASDRCLIFDNLRYADPCPIIRTRSVGFTKVKYANSVRRRAWRNALVAAINEGIGRRLFTVRPGDNRWPGATIERHNRKAHVYGFSIGDIPALASVSDAGYDELSIHVALWPTNEGARWVECVNVGFYAGDLYASAWLERRDGAWLQVSRSGGLGQTFRCRRKRLNTAAALQMEPLGYADRGSFKL
jgi:hypothetical protein